MKKFLKIIFPLTFLLFYAVTSAFAETELEYLIGFVVSVDREARQFVLVVDQRSDLGRELAPTPDSSEAGRRLNVLLDKDSRRPFMPNCVVPGELVRVWGHSSTDLSVFRASDIRGTRGWGRERSGIRGRIGRGRWSGGGSGSNEDFK